MTIPDILWTPPPDALQHSRFGAWLRWLETERQLRFDGYHDAWAWSVDDLEGFWSSICSFLSVTWHRPPDRILAGQEMPGTVWCPGATVNYAEHALGAGARVEAYDEHGQPVIDEQGSLVVTAPMPSMPVGLWGDTDGSRYRAAYFETFPGVWDHGDWITITARGTCVITGRSDSTLNRGGVRLGTSDFYAVVEALPEISDSLVIHLDDPDGGPGELLLFVTTAEGSKLDDDLRDRICRALRANLSPRHVPDRTIKVKAIPRTLFGQEA